MEINNCIYVIVMIYKSVYIKFKIYFRGKYNVFWVEFFLCLLLYFLFIDF